MAYPLFVSMIKKDKLLLPPLSGYTDYPYRCILSKFDASFLCTEMVNAKAVIEKNQKTLLMIKKASGSHLNGVQLIGNDPKEMKKAAILLEKSGFDYIDVNMGCTVKKIVRKGQGVALMDDESLAVRIMEEMYSSVDIPITVKMRSGRSENKKNAVSLSKKLESVGVSAITIHGRTGDKKFGTSIDYDIIRNVSNAVDIPVIANGGITEKNLLTVISYTHTDAVMPGRNLIGNPWLIPQMKSQITKKPFSHPSLSERKRIVRNHLTNECKFYGEMNGILQFRSILPKYFRYCQNLNQLKDVVKQMISFPDAMNILERISECDKGMCYQ